MLRQGGQPEFPDEIAGDEVIKRARHQPPQAALQQHAVFRACTFLMKIGLKPPVPVQRAGGHGREKEHKIAEIQYIQLCDAPVVDVDKRLHRAEGQIAEPQHRKRPEGFEPQRQLDQQQGEQAQKDCQMKHPRLLCAPAQVKVAERQRRLPGPERRQQQKCVRRAENSQQHDRADEHAAHTQPHPLQSAYDHGKQHDKKNQEIIKTAEWVHVRLLPRRTQAVRRAVFCRSCRWCSTGSCPRPGFFAGSYRTAGCSPARI